MSLEECRPFALWLAKRYGGTHRLLEYDDVYQIAMTAAWRNEGLPHQHRLRQMRWSVLAELRKLTSPSRVQDTLTFDDQRALPSQASVEKDTVAHLMAVYVYEMINDLPDDEFQIMLLKLHDCNLRELSLDLDVKEDRLRYIWKKARKRMKAWLKEREVVT